MLRQAVILVGGLGSRLGALTASLPKPMLDVGGRPFLDYVIANLTRFGASEILLLAGFRGEVVRAAYHGREAFGATLSVAVEPEPLGTGGALSFASDQLAAEFLLVNGDTYFDADLARVILGGTNDHDGVVLLTQVEDTVRYGLVQLSDDGHIRRFIEKPITMPARGLINAGTYLLRKRPLLDAIGHRRCSLETDVLPDLAARGRLMGIVGSGTFVDIGVPSGLELARKNLLEWRRRPAAFLDRDGVLNRDDGYTHRAENLCFMPDAIEAVRLLNESRFYVIVVSNQAGIAHGYFNHHALSAFHQSMQDRLLAQGAHIDSFYFCPHHPAGRVADYAVVCGCRKPGTGMLEQAMRDWPIDLQASFLIGDRDSDLAAAHSFGIPGFQYSGGSLHSFIKERVLSRLTLTRPSSRKQNQE